MTAIAACRTCGTEPLENARFCHGCGSPVQDGDTHAEYKQVTVLFADVVHSIDIAAAVGPERLREIMAELVSRGGPRWAASSKWCGPLSLPSAGRRCRRPCAERRRRADNSPRWSSACVWYPSMTPRTRTTPNGQHLSPAGSPHIGGSGRVLTSDRP